MGLGPWVAHLRVPCAPKIGLHFVWGSGKLVGNTTNDGVRKKRPATDVDLGVESLSILSKHRSFEYQTGFVSLGVRRFSRKIRIPEKYEEGSTRTVPLQIPT